MTTTDPERIAAFELRCSKCRRMMAAHRDDMDPAEAAVMEIICPTCDDGDRHSPRYFRADGSELLFGRDFGLAVRSAILGAAES